MLVNRLADFGEKNCILGVESGAGEGEGLAVNRERKSVFVLTNDAAIAYNPRSFDCLVVPFL